jgi:hypothetical protein
LLWHSKYEMDDKGARRLAAALAAVPLHAGALVGLLALYVGGSQCDESCTGEGWQHTAGAWQWSLYPVLGAIVFLAGVVTFVFVRRRRPGGAFASLAVGTVVFFAGLAWSGDGWRESLTRHPLIVGLIACIVIAGALAALLSAGSDPEGA